jgi:hypothetical protein
MVWTRGLAFPLPYHLFLCKPSLFVIVLRPPRFRLRLLSEKEKRRRLVPGFCAHLGFRLKFKWFFVLPPARSELIPFVIPDSLLNPALLNGLRGDGMRIGPNGYTVYSIQMCLEDAFILVANLTLELLVWS